MSKQLVSVIIGDTHSGDDAYNPMVPEIHPIIHDKIIEIGPDRLFHTGDVVHLGADYYDHFQPTWGDLVSIMHPSAGNHDENVEQFKEFFGLGALRYYIYDKKFDTLFVVLNVPSCRVDVSNQYLYVQSVLQQHSAAKFKFLFMHVPPYTNGMRGGCTQAQDWDLGMFDMIFSGHTHGYERYGKFIVTGRVGAYGQTSTTNPYVNMDVSLIEGNNNHNYVVLVVNKDQAVVKAYNHFGENLDWFVVNKPEGVSDQTTELPNFTLERE